MKTLRLCLTFAVIFWSFQANSYVFESIEDLKQVCNPEFHKFVRQFKSISMKLQIKDNIC